MDKETQLKIESFAQALTDHLWDLRGGPWFGEDLYDIVWDFFDEWCEESS